MNLSYLSQILGLPQYPTPPIIERPPIVTPNPNVTVIPKNMDDSYYPVGQLPLPVAPPPYLMPPDVAADIGDVLPEYPTIPDTESGVAEVRPPVQPSPDVMPSVSEPVIENPPGLLEPDPVNMMPPANIGSMDAGIPLNPDAAKASPAAAPAVGGINPFSLGLSLLADANKPAPRPAPPPAIVNRPQMVSVDNLIKLYRGGLL